MKSDILIADCPLKFIKNEIPSTINQMDTNELIECISRDIMLYRKNEEAKIGQLRLQEFNHSQKIFCNEKQIPLPCSVSPVNSHEGTLYNTEWVKLPDIAKFNRLVKFINTYPKGTKHLKTMLIKELRHNPTQFNGLVKYDSRIGSIISIDTLVKDPITSEFYLVKETPIVRVRKITKLH